MIRAAALSVVLLAAGAPALADGDTPQASTCPVNVSEAVRSLRSRWKGLGVQVADAKADGKINDDEGKRIVAAERELQKPTVEFAKSLRESGRANLAKLGSALRIAVTALDAADNDQKWDDDLLAMEAIVDALSQVSASCIGQGQAGSQGPPKTAASIPVQPMDPYATMQASDTTARDSTKKILPPAAVDAQKPKPAVPLMTCDGDEECVRINSRQLWPAPAGTAPEVLGSGLDEELSEFDSAGAPYRVLPPKFTDTPDNRIQSKFEAVDDELSWKVNARYLGISAGAQGKQEKRYLVLTAYRISRVLVLQHNDEMRSNDAKLVAEKIYYGAALNWIVEGDASTLTAEVAAQIGGFGAEASAARKSAGLKVTFGSIGFDSSQSVPIPQDVQELQTQLSVAAPQPILIEYRAIKPFKVKRLWNQPFVGTGKYKVTATVELQDAVDIEVRILVSGKGAVADCNGEHQTQMI